MQGEIAAEFVVELRKLLEQCQFGASLNKMLRDRLVSGVTDGRLQRCLLAEPDLTFKKAFELCQVSELAEENAKVLQAGQKQSLKMAGASVMVLRSEVGDRMPASGTNCYRCNGTQHLARDCHFKAAVCHACGKTGYIARACCSKGNTQSRERGGKKHSHASVQRTHQLTAEDKQDETSYVIFQMSAPREAPIQVTVMLDQAEVAMEVDTGASISVMSESTFRKTWKGSGPKLQSSNVCVKTYTGESLDVIGCIVVDVEYEGQRESLPLHIVGQDWLHKLKLNWPAICHLSSSPTIESVLDMHSAVFNEKLGNVSKDPRGTRVYPTILQGQASPVCSTWESGARVRSRARIRSHRARRICGMGCSHCAGHQK